MKKKETRGGKRPGSGQPSKYGEETENITFRVPKSRKAEVKKLVNDHLKQYVVERRRGNIVTTYEKKDKIKAYGFDFRDIDQHLIRIMFSEPVHVEPWTWPKEVEFITEEVKTKKSKS